MNPKRTTAQIQSLLEEYRRSGLSRREFAQRQNVPVTTLDYWRHKQDKARLVEVTVEAPRPAARFSVVLANGRRIEISAHVSDSELARLIRIVESA